MFWRQIIAEIHIIMLLDREKESVTDISQFFIDYLHCVQGRVIVFNRESIMLDFSNRVVCQISARKANMHIRHFRKKVWIGFSN